MSAQADRLFEEALNLEHAERIAFVENACADRPELRDEVIAMLEEVDAADNFFNKLQEAVFSASASSGDEDDDDAQESEFNEGDNVGHYRIVSLIGRGGMGRVFRAHDTRLNRDVALKFLPSHLGGDPDEQARLLVEARAAAVLEHPNVCSIHEIGETSDGRLFITMPCYDGETLKDKMRRDSLSVQETLRIGTQIARGLAAAHSHGIIHRDVKPGNVMIASDGTVRLLDFGLAMAMTGTAVQSGVTRGTIAYMSPEQIRGESLDSRTDLWSLGVLLYEMLTGKRPFKGATQSELIQSILHDDYLRLADRRADLDPAITEVVDRLLQKDPVNRYSSALDVALALDYAIAPASPSHERSFIAEHRGMFTGIALVAVLAGGLLGWRAIKDRAAFQSKANRAQPSLAVLPISNVGGDSSDAALATGMMEDLIATIASAGDVRVIASTSVAGFRNSNMDVRAIADSLGVTNILEGGIQRTGSRLRVQMRLVDGKDGITRWSESYDREFKEMFAVQNEIVRAVAGELELRFDRDRQFTRHRTRNIEAYDLYLRAADPVLLRGQSGIWTAQDYYQRAISADPQYAAPHAGLALTYVRRARNASDPGMPVPELIRLAESEARKAIALDSTLAEGYNALGRVRELTLDFAGAEAAIQKAIELDPNRSVYRRSLSYMRSWSGRAGDELAEAQRALETDPLNPYAITAFASGLYGNHRYDEAIAQLERVMGIKPPLQGAVFAMAQCYAKKGMLDKAIAMLRPNAEAGDPLYKALLGNFLARSGQHDEANTLLAELQARRDRAGAGAFHIAVVYAGLGDRDRTFEWLNKSIDDRSIGSFIMGPTFEELRSDPRFNMLRKRLGLPPIASQP